MNGVQFSGWYSDWRLGRKPLPTQRVIAHLNDNADCFSRLAPRTADESQGALASLVGDQQAGDLLKTHTIRLGDDVSIPLTPLEVLSYFKRGINTNDIQVFRAGSTVGGAARGIANQLLCGKESLFRDHGVKMARQLVPMIETLQDAGLLKEDGPFEEGGYMYERTYTDACSWAFSPTKLGKQVLRASSF